MPIFFFDINSIGYPVFWGQILLSMSCNSLCQAALKAAKQSKDGRNEEIVALRSEVEVKYANL